MKEMKVSELTGPTLDWAVAKCERVEFTHEEYPWHELTNFTYSADWSSGGLIIEREAISTRPIGSKLWEAERWGSRGQIFGVGPTPLIAAMRCYVASKLGDEIFMPDLKEGEEPPETFVVVSFHEHEPMQLHGPFTSSKAAYDWADRNSTLTHFSVNAILEATEE